MPTRRRKPLRACDRMPAQLDSLLADGSSWSSLWNALTSTSGFPRPPVLVPAVHRRELLELLPSMVAETSYLGHTLPTSEAFGRFLRLRAEDEASAPDPVYASQLHAGQLHAQLVRLCLSKAELDALQNPADAQSLVEAARLFAYLLSEEDEPVLSIDGLWMQVEVVAVQAEVESVAGLVAALQGQEATARSGLGIASAILETPKRLRTWGRTRQGRLRRVDSAARFDLRGHARWLGCASQVEASLGELAAARRLARDAEELYLQARDYFAAGLQAYHLARLAGWQAQPARAAEELERALQLLDLRTAPRLRRRLLVELAFFYFEAGAAVRGSEEMELARRLQPCPSDLDAARGLLFIHTGEVPEGLRCLRKAREQANVVPQAPTHAQARPAQRSLPVLTLDVVEAELTLPSPRRDPARWLETKLLMPPCAGVHRYCKSAGTSSRRRSAQTGSS